MRIVVWRGVFHIEAHKQVALGWGMMMWQKYTVDNKLREASIIIRICWDRILYDVSLVKDINFLFKCSNIFINYANFLVLSKSDFKPLIDLSIQKP